MLAWASAFLPATLVLGFGGGLGPEQAQGLQGERPFSDTALKGGSGPHRALQVTPRAELGEIPWRKPLGPTKLVIHIQKIGRDDCLFRVG